MAALRILLALRDPKVRQILERFLADEEGVHVLPVEADPFGDLEEEIRAHRPAHTLDSVTSHTALGLKKGFALLDQGGILELWRHFSPTGGASPGPEGQQQEDPPVSQRAS